MSYIYMSRLHTVLNHYAITTETEMLSYVSNTGLVHPCNKSWLILAANITAQECHVLGWYVVERRWDCATLFDLEHWENIAIFFINNIYLSYTSFKSLMW